MGRLILVLGGARSGKSAFAERLLATKGGRILYVATAEAGDGEMEERIRRHRQRRPPSWGTVEAPLDPVAALDAAGTAWDGVLLDSVSLWLSNIVANAPSAEAAARAEREARDAVAGLVAWQRGSAVDLVAVSDEVGMGIVPAFPLGRYYRDVLGQANQMLAAEADQVYLVVAGLPVPLKGTDALAGTPAGWDVDDSD